MIILDTSIIAEMMKASPAPQVANWLDQQYAADLYITTVTIAEIAYGLEGILESSRRGFLQKAFHRMIEASFKHRILSFDERATPIYARLMQHRIRQGEPMSVIHGQIAAITVANESILATRHIHHFSDCGIDVINPFIELETVEFEEDFDLASLNE